MMNINIFSIYPLHRLYRKENPKFDGILKKIREFGIGQFNRQKAL
jgi:hypothetical protein